MHNYINKIICGNCLDIIKDFPDKSIDLTLTDFPYGNNTDYGNSYKDTQNNLKQLISNVLPEILRVSKRTFISVGTMNIGLYSNPDWVICWATPAGTGIGKWGFCCWHPIIVYGKDPYLENRMGSRPDYFVSHEKASNNIHPCSKPLGVWKKLLLR